MSWSLRRKFSALLVGIGCTVGSAQAGPYSDMFVFGDSLTDTGNVLALTTAFQPPPFPSFPGAEGRFSNGPAWIEYLAAGLGLPQGAQPSRLLPVPLDPVNFPTVLTPIPIGAPGGQNFAYGGARTGLGGAAGPTTGLLAQLISWNGVPFDVLADSLTRAADPNALYVVVAGANDLRDIRNANFGSSPADIAARAAAAQGIAGNVVNVVGALAQQGARHFLISNLPDLGKTPEAANFELDPNKAGIQVASTQVTDAFNTALDAGAQQLDSFFDVFFHVQLDIRELDFHGLVDAVFADPAAFGVTNTNAPCINPVVPGLYFFAGSTGPNCNSALFSDDLHPSARAHQLIGEAALRAVPLPNSIALVMLAGAMLVVVRRRAA